MSRTTALVLNVAATLALCTVVWAGVVVFLNFRRASESEDVLKCKHNIQAVAAAVREFHVDQRRLPSRLDDLVGYGRLAGLPKCPSSPSGAYSMAVERGRGADYTIFCPGLNHRWLDIPRDFPQYSSLKDEVFYRPARE